MHHNPDLQPCNTFLSIVVLPNALPSCTPSNVQHPQTYQSTLASIPQPYHHTLALSHTHALQNNLDFTHQSTLSHDTCFVNSDHDDESQSWEERSDAVNESVWDDMRVSDLSLPSPIITLTSPPTRPQHPLSKHAVIFIPLKHRKLSTQTTHALIQPLSPDMTRATCNKVNFLLRTRTLLPIVNNKSPRLCNTMITPPLMYTLTPATCRTRVSKPPHYTSSPLSIFIHEHVARVRKSIALFVSLIHLTSIRTSHSHLLSVLPLRTNKTQFAPHFSVNPSYFFAVQTVLTLPTCGGHFLFYIMSFFPYFFTCLRAGHWLRLGIG